MKRSKFKRQRRAFVLVFSLILLSAWFAYGMAAVYVNTYNRLNKEQISIIDADFDLFEPLIYLEFAGNEITLPLPDVPEIPPLAVTLIPPEIRLTLAAAGLLGTTTRDAVRTANRPWGLVRTANRPWLVRPRTDLRGAAPNPPQLSLKESWKEQQCELFIAQRCSQS